MDHFSTSTLNSQCCHYHYQQHLSLLGPPIIKIPSSLFFTSVVEQLRLASSAMEDGVSVQGPATCCIQREGAQGVPTPYYLLLAAHGAARCPNRHSRQLSAMFHLTAGFKKRWRRPHLSFQTQLSNVNK